ADDAHHQPRAGAGVAEIERRAGRKQCSEAGPADPPAARRQALDDRTQSFTGFAGAQDVVALEQPIDLGLAASQEAEDEGAMGNRLVAGRAEPAVEPRPTDRAQRRGTALKGS